MASHHQRASAGRTLPVAACNPHDPAPSAESFSNRAPRKLIAQFDTRSGREAAGLPRADLKSRESKAMRISRLGAWIAAGVIGLAGAPALSVSGSALAADAKPAAQASEAPDNDICLGCHGNEGFATPTVWDVIRQCVGLSAVAP